MSTEMTFRQKLIRIGCGAAVCGLSFSFLIGEIVDNQARDLRTWTTDSKLFPEGYLPLLPIQTAMTQFETSPWLDHLIAVNQAPGTLPSVEVAKASEELPVREEPIRPQVSSGLEWMKASDSYPLHFRAAAPEVKKGSKPIKEAKLKTTEVETILVSIHDAQRKLSANTTAAPTNSVAVTNSTTTKVAPAPAPEAVVAKNDLYIESDSPLADTPPATKVSRRSLLASKPSKTVESVGHWVIQGKILSLSARNAEPGHFEVGLFSKIDPENHPVGFPLPQQILPAGQTAFRLEVPSRIEKGYLFAEFISAKTGKRTLVTPPNNPWVRGQNQTAEMFYKADDVIASIASAPISERWKVQGQITTMFASSVIPQGEVVVKVRGRKEAARSDRQGNFAIDLPRIKGTLFLEVLKNGYHPTIVSVTADDSRPLHIEIASRHAIDQISQRLGANQGSTHGILVGQATSTDGAGIRGVAAQLAGLKADGPFYFDEDGNASREIKSTTGNGKFLFLNVEAGTGYLETNLNGDPIAPLQISSVEGGELMHKSLTPESGTIKGRIFNPVTGGKLVPLVGARVRVDGASEWVTSDSYGAFSIGPMRWSKGERISIEVSAEKFNNHRYLVSADATNLSLFAFPAMYIARLARSMDVDLDPYSGVIIGKVSGPSSLRMDALADHSTVNNARDFYFDSKGRLRGSHEMTDPRFGTYIIFNVPKGRTLLQGNDGGGVLKYSDSVIANPSSINVLME